MNSITRKSLSSFVLIFSMLASVFSGFLLIPSTAQAAGVTRYVSTSGSDSGNCTSSPCRTITYGISQLQGGDTLIVGNGTYNDPFRNIPSGSSGSYTTIKAESDFGVTVNASTYPAPDIWGKIGSMYNASYITIRGFKFYGPGAPSPTGGSHHIKFIKNVFAYGDVSDNTALGVTGPASDYVLYEDNIAYGGGRYMYETYQSNHTVFRRNVARNDYYLGSWQSASFTSYDADNTAWINNIALDSNKSCCTRFFYGGHWNEKNLTESKTNQRFLGNILLNVHTDFGANNDTKASGSRIMMDNIYWDTDNGYLGEQGPGDSAVYDLMTNFTVGGMRSSNMSGSGIGISINNNVSNLVKNSILANNSGTALAGNARGSHNAFSGNGSNGASGSGDITNVNIVGNVLKYLPRGAEPGTALANGGDNGGRIGAQVMWKIGLDGTLWGEPGWDVVRSPENGYGRPEDRLWPWANEAFIKQEMGSASYPGGLQGSRGFAAPGNGLYGGPRTLTSYIWEYLGSPMPSVDQMYSNLPINPPTVTTTPIPTPFPTINPTPQPSNRFSVNQRVQTTSNLNVRSSPSTSASILGTVSNGGQGTVVSGPTSANGFNWWRINFDSGLTGWSVEDFLTESTGTSQNPLPLSSIPPPNNLVLSCPSPGTRLTATWSMPGGYSQVYIRANVGANNDTFPSLIQVPELSQQTGNTYSFNTTPGQTYYFWLNTKDSNTGNYSLLPADGNVTCQTDNTNPTPTPYPTYQPTPVPGTGSVIPATFFGLSFNHSIPAIEFGSTRTWDSWGISWGGMNPARGVYNWHQLDEFITDMENKWGPKEILFTFGRTPAWATGGRCTGPYAPNECTEPPANIADWDAFVTEIVTRYKDKIKYWETWNEFNDPAMFQGSMDQMALLAKHLYQIVHAIQPGGLVLSPSAYATPNWTNCYLRPVGEQCVQGGGWIGPTDRPAGGNQWADIIAYHDAYITDSLELDDRLKEYTQVIADAGAGGKPVWDTEASFGDIASLSSDQSTSQVAIRYLLMWSNDVDRFLWYTWDTSQAGMLKDESTGGPNRQGVAFEQVYKWMVGATMPQKCTRGGNGTWTCGLARGGGYQALAVWNDSGSQSSYSAGSQYKQYRDLAGNVRNISGGVVPIGIVPILLETGNPGTYIPTPTPTPYPTYQPTPTPYPTATPITSGKFNIGQRIQTTDNLNVRSSANLTSTLRGTQFLGSLGTVTGGPTSQGGYIWWNINYDSGVDGWSVENFLASYSPAPTPLPTPLSQIPPPTNLILTCPAPGNRLTATWSMPSGYSLVYIRANVGANNDTFPSLIQVPELGQQTGNTYSFNTTPGQTYYFWLNTKDSNNGNYSLLPADGNVTCQFSDVVVPTPTPTTSGPQGPAGYTFCAYEYESCNFTGTKTVAYGLNGTYTYKQFTNGIGCSNANFTDPLVGVDKACFVTSSSPTPTPTPQPTVNPTPTPTGGKFSVDQRVQTTANLNVRDLPSTTGTILGAQPLASQGMVMSGPMLGGGYSWWYIIYDTGIAGWSVENYLVAVGGPTPTPQPTVNPTPTPPAGSPTGPSGYTFCAYEYGSCNFSGTRRVAYGLNGTYVYRDLTPPVSCGNSTFSDPLVGVDKACFISQFTTTPVTTPTPTPQPTVRPSVTPQPTVNPTPIPTPIPTSTGGFRVGSNIVVTGTVNVRSQPVTTSLIQGVQYTGATGTITEGPTTQGGYTWWRIDYSTGADGWSIESALAVTGTGPQPTPTPTSQPTPTPTFQPTPTPTAGPVGSTLFPPDSWFYRDISNYELDAENSLVINALNRVGWGFGALRIDFSIDVLKADANTPYVNWTTNSDFWAPSCDHAPMPLPAGGSVEGESGYQCTQDGDCHLLVIDPYKKLLMEMFRAGAPASQSSTSNFKGGCQAVWDLTKTVPLTGRGEYCTSVDAAGYPVTALLINADEVYDAVYNGKPINHATRFILPNERIRETFYVRPATHLPGSALTGDMDMPPYGTLLRLRADYPLQNLPNDGARAVARAMQKYGMYLADGGNIALTFQSDRRTTHKWSELGMDDGRSMTALKPSDFEMVDGGSRIRFTEDCTRTQITTLPR